MGAGRRGLIDGGEAAMAVDGQVPKTADPQSHAESLANRRTRSGLKVALLRSSLVPAARFAYHAWHYGRWSWRFGAFGFGSTLGKPMFRLARYPNVFIGGAVHLGPLWRIQVAAEDATHESRSAMAPWRTTGSASVPASR